MSIVSSVSPEGADSEGFGSDEADDGGLRRGVYESDSYRKGQGLAMWGGVPISARGRLGILRF